MIKASAILPPDLKPLAEARLWQAVILNTVQDWLSGSLRLKREAEQYLFGDDSDFHLVCESAGFEMSSFRARLLLLRSQRVNVKCATPA